LPVANAQSLPPPKPKQSPASTIEQVISETAINNFAPPDLKLAYYEAEAQYQAENYKEAQAAFQRLIDSFSSPETKQHLVGAMYRMAQLHAMEYTYSDAKNGIQTHKPDVIQALYYMETALWMQPNHIDLLYLKATLEYNHNRPQKAAQTLLQLCALDPHSFTFHHFTAIALSQTMKGPIATHQAQSLLSFCDTWENHLGKTEKVQQFRQLALDQLQIKDIEKGKQNNKPASPTQATAKQPVLSTPNKYRKFLALCIEMNRYQEAHLWADSLESVAPVFSAHNLVNAFSHACNNKWELAQAETANSQVETDPFILNQYLRISARIASHQAQQHPNFGNPKLPETEAALNLWIDLHQREGLTPNDLPFAISIADQAHSVQYLTLWKQMAQDLKTSPSQK
jgi:tetratricopeptide (TPR) repeat protein